VLHLGPPLRVASVREFTSGAGVDHDEPDVRMYRNLLEVPRPAIEEQHVTRLRLKERRLVHHADRHARRKQLGPREHRGIGHPPFGHGQRDGNLQRCRRGEPGADRDVRRDPAAHTAERDARIVQRLHDSPDLPLPAVLGLGRAVERHACLTRKVPRRENDLIGTRLGL
jgi:hypothetical protein